MRWFDKIFRKDNSCCGVKINEVKADKKDCCNITYEEVKENNDTYRTQK
ncbi:hypothetical protein [Bacillus paralicheniformis]|nr:hypothetical protein [Bacillus paralicheniformis]UZN54723.1 hypothetical protein OPU65_23035 [Bacillus paralicheniformis]